MGINKENLLSDEHHASHFSCAICQDLSESPAILACSHVFCEFCIGEYVANCVEIKILRRVRGRRVIDATRLLDGVAMPVPRRSTEPGRPRHCREMT